MKFDMSNAKALHGLTETLGKEAEGFAKVNALYARVLILMHIGLPDDELHLATDPYSEYDLGWYISRPGQEAPVMCGLLHYDGKGDWSSHT